MRILSGLAEKVSPALQQQKIKVDKKLKISNIFKDEKVPPLNLC